jgi:hypothetical protein
MRIGAANDPLRIGVAYGFAYDIMPEETTGVKYVTGFVYVIGAGVEYVVGAAYALGVAYEGVTMAGYGVGIVYVFGAGAAYDFVL